MKISNACLMILGVMGTVVGVEQQAHEADRALNIEEIVDEEPEGDERFLAVDEVEVEEVEDSVLEEEQDEARRKLGGYYGGGGGGGYYGGGGGYYGGGGGYYGGGGGYRYGKGEGYGGYRYQRPVQQRPVYQRPVYQQPVRYYRQQPVVVQQPLYVQQPYYYGCRGGKGYCGKAMR